MGAGGIFSDGNVGINGDLTIVGKVVNSIDAEPDLIVGGTANTAAGDNGVISSDPDFPGSDLLFRTNDAFAVFLDFDESSEDSDFEIFHGPGTDTLLFNVGEDGTVTAAGMIVHSSDVHRKERLESVDADQVLDAILDMPMHRWSYRVEATRHLGPTAQDFKAAFGLGQTDTGIATVDGDGVALAAIQGLKPKTGTRKRPAAGATDGPSGNR